MSTKIAVLTNFLAFFVGIFLFKDLKKEIRPVFYFVALGVLNETVSQLFMRFVMKNTMPFGHFYFPVAFLLLSWFYIQVLKDFIKPVYLITVVVLFELYAIINSTVIQSIFEYASLEFSIGSIILFMFSVLFFVKVMVETKITRLAQNPLIWINVAVLVYYAVNISYHGLYNLRIGASKEVTQMAIVFFFITNFIFYLLITIAFLKCRKNPGK